MISVVKFQTAHRESRRWLVPKAASGAGHQGVHSGRFGRRPYGHRRADTRTVRPRARTRIRRRVHRRILAARHGELARVQAMGRQAGKQFSTHTQTSNPLRRNHIHFHKTHPHTQSLRPVCISYLDNRTTNPLNKYSNI